MTTGKNLQPRRKGIILLLVLAVLAMFAMLMATFMVVSSQQYREAASVERLNNYVQSPEDDLDSTIAQMLVGSTRKISVIRARTFGDTMYGDAAQDGLTGMLNGIWGESYLSLVAPMKYERFGMELVFNDTGSLPQSTAEWLALKGNVITLYDDVQKQWKSARILDFDASTAIFSGGRLTGITVITTAIPDTRQPIGTTGSYEDRLNVSIQRRFLNAQPFYINPPAFVGTGAGYTITPLDDMTIDFWAGYGKPLLSEVDGGIPFAYQLNPNAPLSDGLAGFGNLLDNFAWSLNVDYTAPDAASPFLGWFDMQFANNGAFDPTTSVIIPSYHRPSLITLYNPTNVDVLRKLVMRPLPFDHPEFDGSNPPLAFTNIADLIARLSDTHGTYLDVDTDGDGIKDSVWVDVGLPVRTDLQGRTYKPLVAIKCIDLDGKLNLNAIGNLAEAGLLNSDPLGSGFGSAGTNLSLGLSTIYFNDPEIAEKVTDALFLRRYLGNGETIPRDSGNALTDSILAQFAGLPSATPLYNFFGNPPDYWDQGMLQFDPLGNRFNNTNHVDMGFVPYSLTNGASNGFWGFPAATTNAFVTNPYMFDPNRKTPYDQPFTLAELEAILRQNDIDKDVLPGRLREMFGLNAVGAARIFTNMELGTYPHDPYHPDNAALFQQLKNELNSHANPIAYHTTTLSNDVPVPGPALADQGYAGLYDLIYGCAVKSGAADPDTVALQLINFLPDEIKQGGKVNLNKLVEDPTMFLSNSMNAAEYENALYERMKMARGIYIILTALSYDKLYGVWNGGDCIVEPYIEPSFLQAEKIKDLYDNPSTRNEAFRVCRELATTRLAQWAINVVEFTDTDAVMTPFVFDVDPFDGNGWGARNITDTWGLFNGSPNEFGSISSHADYRLAWGMERPDLLLTETLAFHDRRVADTNAGGSAVLETHRTYITVDPDTGIWSFDPLATPTEIQTTYTDDDYDKVRIPQGSAFLEIYCAADPNRPNYPQELYNGNELDISRLTGNNVTGDPVWRAVVSGSNYQGNGKKYKSETEAKMEYSIPHRLKDYGPLFTFQTNQPGGVPVEPSLIPLTDSSFNDLKKPFTEDRIVWFTPKQPDATADNVYYNHSNNISDRLTLAPNEYLVVGPRVVTHLTSQQSASAHGNPTGSPKIDLLDLIASSSPIGKHKVMVAAAEVSATVPVSDSTGTNWVGNNYGQTCYLGNIAVNSGLGFSISEPFRSQYYTQPTVNNSYLTSEFGVAIVDGYTGAGVQNMEEPIDGSAKPLSTAGLVGTGVAPFYKSVFLQRVADPNRPYNATTNPYITVDWNMFDLKVYTGESVDSDTEDGNFFGPPLKEGSVTKYFASRQWGVSNTLLPSRTSVLPNPWDRALDWDNVKDATSITDVSTAASDFGVAQGITLTGLTSPIQLPYQPNLAFSGALAFDQFPVHSLGRLGTDPKLMHPQLASTLAVPPVVPMSQAQAAALASDPQYAYVNNLLYYGAPLQLNVVPTVPPESITGNISPKPFQYLPWHNGPLANSYEVMQVPASTPGRFGVEFVDKLGDTDAYKTNYLMRGHLWVTTPVLHADSLSTSVDGTHVVPEKRSGSLGSNIRFGHLLNFQHAHSVDSLDYTKAAMPNGVASPGDTFVFANRILPLDGSGNILATDLWQHGFPLLTFDFTDRPTIGVKNTVGAVTKAEFVSLDLGNALNFLNVPSRFVGTRDWYQDGTGKYYGYSRFREPGKINLNTMTASGFTALLENREFAGMAPDYGVFDETRGNNIAGNGFFTFDLPFRGSSSAMLNVDVPYVSSTDTTLLRSQKNIGTGLNTGVPTFAPPVDDVTQHGVYTSDNAYTALEGIQRLSDMTTTRSNAFAVWMTLGYFEVEKIQPGQVFPQYSWTAPSQPAFDAIYPDGYVLKKEVGLETGEIKRHRAFYIIDRSVPFGYRRGQKLNSEDAILLKRFIE